MQLAPHVERILGVDVSQVAIEGARRRAAGCPNVAFRCGDLDSVSASEGPFDLIAVVDVLYYVSGLDAAMLDGLIARLRGLLSDDGVVLLANHHFFGIDRGSRETRAIHGAFRRSRDLVLMRERWFPFFLASVFAAAPAPTPA